MILAFPVALVSSMRMELKKKAIVMAVLSLGVFSVSKTYLLVHLLFLSRTLLYEASRSLPRY